MATTTNFGWETPDDTDLVKDGAAAMRTLGNSIDTSFVDLKGGTTNQVLAKNSNTDLDFKWVADATGIPATIIDAKGDLIAGTASDTADRLAVGTNGQVLTADSTTATGLKWAATSLTANGCAVYKNTAQTLANTTMTEITWELEYFDTNSYHSTVSNTGRLSVPQAGMYFVGASITMASSSTAGREMRIRRYNSSNVVQEYRYQESDFTINGNSCQTLHGIFQASAGDYFTIEQYQASGGNLDTSSFAGNVTAYIYLIGA